MQLLKRLKTTVSKSRNRPVKTTIPTDQAYDILSNDRRRRTIAYLAGFDVGTEVDVRDISSAIVTEEESREAVYVALIQSHICQLSPRDTTATAQGQVAVVDYDERAKTVTVRPELHALHEAHSAFRDNLA